ncbi:hypothetical protein M0811_00614 [Anaeramoeba ignava]|uniref:Uncharacterized protein n=1 Tax=Anaeramoeba ignava TaxID=1746090 RepID=A0A9Q0RG20_ANAIG|nr:hypothetical protein M0811_00614 [Anaeramoeba ignava]
MKRFSRNNSVQIFQVDFPNDDCFCINLPSSVQLILKLLSQYPQLKNIFPFLDNANLFSSMIFSLINEHPIRFCVFVIRSISKMKGRDELFADIASFLISCEGFWF